VLPKLKGTPAQIYQQGQKILEEILNHTYKNIVEGFYELFIELKNKWNKLKDKNLPVDLVDFKITEKGRREFEYLNSLPKLQETDSFYNYE